MKRKSLDAHELKLHLAVICLRLDNRSASIEEGELRDFISFHGLWTFPLSIVFAHTTLDIAKEIEKRDRVEGNLFLFAIWLMSYGLISWQRGTSLVNNWGFVVCQKIKNGMSICNWHVDDNLTILRGTVWVFRNLNLKLCRQLFCGLHILAGYIVHYYWKFIW